MDHAVSTPELDLYLLSSGLQGRIQGLSGLPVTHKIGLWDGLTSPLNPKP